MATRGVALGTAELVRCHERERKRTIYGRRHPTGTEKKRDVRRAEIDKQRWPWVVCCPRTATSDGELRRRSLKPVGETVGGPDVIVRHSKRADCSKKIRRNIERVVRKPTKFDDIFRSTIDAGGPARD